MYFVIAFILTRGMRLLERRARAGIGQGPARGEGVLSKLSIRERTSQVEVAGVRKVAQSPGAATAQPTAERTTQGATEPRPTRSGRLHRMATWLDDLSVHAASGRRPSAEGGTR